MDLERAYDEPASHAQGLEGSQTSPRRLKLPTSPCRLGSGTLRRTGREATSGSPPGRSIHSTRGVFATLLGWLRAASTSLEPVRVALSSPS
jgi:hypothetical protein